MTSSYLADSEFTEEKILPYRILSVIVDNKPGVLFRVTNLFRARNFNIESITVGTTEQKDISRMTIAIQSDYKTLDQLVKQLRKLIDIIEVRVLDTENTVFRELALIKMKASDELPFMFLCLKNKNIVLSENLLHKLPQATVWIVWLKMKLETQKSLLLCCV